MLIIYIYSCPPFSLFHSTITLLKSHPTSGGQSSKLLDLLRSSLQILVQVKVKKEEKKKPHVHITSPILANLTQLSLCISVIYKTSLLHLQPRQMTIYLPEVRKISHDFMSLPVFNPNVFSEDEDDLPGVNE